MSVPLDVVPLKANPPVDFRQLLRRSNGLPPAPALVAVPSLKPVSPPATEPQRSARANSDAALNLLSEVSSAMAALMARCEDLERALEAGTEQAARDVAAAHDVAREWQQTAHGLQSQVTQLEGAALDLRKRLDATEEHAANVQAVAERSQHAAAEAECLASLFEEKVIASFGLGSSGHSILESVRNRTQSMLTA